jgi:hypothetical protein
VNRTAITALRRLRQYQLEQEQFKLQARQREELEQATVCAHLQNRLFEETEIEPGSSPAMWQRRSDNVRQLSQIAEQRRRQWRLAAQASKDQIQAVLNAKRKVDIIDRLLERDALARSAERDQSERKLLDDLASARSAKTQAAASTS